MVELFKRIKKGLQDYWYYINHPPPDYDDYICSRAEEFIKVEKK